MAPFSATALVVDCPQTPLLMLQSVIVLLLATTVPNFLAATAAYTGPEVRLSTGADVQFSTGIWESPCKVGGEYVLIFQTSPSLSCLFTKVVTPPISDKPPVHIVIASPTQSGSYPVILFKHGFSCANCAYNQLFEYLASSGYIVVAPQADLNLFSSDCTKEINETAEVAIWITKSLEAVLTVAVSGANVTPNVSKLVMAGHSRGGKVAFAMALGMASIEVPSFSALVTLDPVDCTGCDKMTKPAILEAGCNHKLNQLSFPVLILGTGYGSEGIVPCAPTCCNHAAYFNCSSSPIIYHLVASKYGHLDFLDDTQVWTYAVCKWGSGKSQLRDFTGRLIVAFLESALEGKKEDMEYIVENWESASIKLEEPEIYKEEGTAASFKGEALI